MALLGNSLLDPSDMSTVELTMSLALEAELVAPDGIVPREMNEHIVDISNRHLLTSSQPRDLYVVAHSVLYLTDSVPDIEFMEDEHVADTMQRERVVAKGHLYGVEHLASAAFLGFGLRFYGVDVIEPEPASHETVLVPVESVAMTLASR